VHIKVHKHILLPPVPSFTRSLAGRLSSLHYWANHSTSHLLLLRGRDDIALPSAPERNHLLYVDIVTSERFRGAKNPTPTMPSAATKPLNFQLLVFLTAFVLGQHRADAAPVDWRLDAFGASTPGR
ncbi:unnamed protein product, partial [Polarella glacialis]